MATYFVSSSGGTGAGTLGDPWSLAHAVATGTNGDILYLLDDGVYAVTAQLDFGAVDYMSWTGCNSSGDVDGSRPVIQATAAIAGAMCLTQNNANLITFNNVTFDANGNATNVWQAGECGLHFVGCEITGATGVGILAASNLDSIILDYCKVHANGSHGMQAANGTAYRTRFLNNGGTGWLGTITQCGAHAVQCEFRGNTDDGATNVICTDCSSYDNGDDGYYASTLGAVQITASLAAKNAGEAHRTTRVFLCAFGSGVEANGSTGIGQIEITSQVDAGATIFRSPSDTPPDLRIPTSSPLDGAGAWFAESLWGSTDTRGGIGIGDFEPAAASGGITLTPPHTLGL